MNAATGRRFGGAGLLVLVLILATIWLALGIFRPVYVYDDGIPVVGAVRVLDGELPFRDFYTNYSPGQFYLTAAAFRLFGVSLLVQRLLSVGLRALLVVVAVALLRRLVPPAWLIPGAVVLLLWVGFYGVYGYPGFPALLCALLSVAATGRAYDGDRPRQRSLWLVLAGALAGATALVRQDFGVYVVAAALAMFTARTFGAGREWLAALLRRAREAGFFAAGLALVSVPPALLLARELGCERLFYDLYVWPYELTRGYRGLPWPWPWALSRIVGRMPGPVEWGEALPFSVVPLAYLAAFAELARRWVRGAGSLAEADWLRLHVAILGLILINQARIRSDLIHLAPTFVLALILLVSLAPEWAGAAGPSRRVRVGGLTLLFLALCLPPTVGAFRDSLPFVVRKPPAEQLLPRGGGIALPADQVAAVRYVTARTAPGEPLFVGTARHDRIIFNDALFYFLAERPIATRHHHYDPGLTTRVDVQREIIDELRRAEVPYVVLYAGAERRVEPNRSAVPDAGDLDRFLRGQYVLERRFGDYAIYRRSSS